MEESNFKGNSFRDMLKGKAKAQTELSPEELQARKHEMKTTVHTNYVGHEVAGGAELLPELFILPGRRRGPGSLLR